MKGCQQVSTTCRQSKVRKIFQGKTAVPYHDNSTGVPAILVASTKWFLIRLKEEGF